MTVFSLDTINAARGNAPADAVFKNAKLFNPFTCTWDEGTLAVKDGIILGIGDYTGKTEYDLADRYIVPGLIDAHVHIESSLLTPGEYTRLVAQHGTATVVADPHEIANVAGIAGIDWMLAHRAGLPVDIRYMLPSCVPATPMDVGGAVLDAADLARFKDREGVSGLGEVMNFPGVLGADPGIGKKLELFTVRDGHAPLLSGKDLNAYILAGLQSDHECTRRDEAEEKLKKGMYIYIREGSTEHNIEELASLITPVTAPRCCFATDDCHVDLLMADGHIDRCIRKAIACGVAPELAIRMATLSAAERFRLTDRGALAPGCRADFCIIDDPQKFTVLKVFVAGKVLADSMPVQGPTLPPAFRCTVPSADAIRIHGNGTARVIGIVPHQIVTDSLKVPINEHARTENDILKVVVCNRYGTGACGVGLVQGFKFSQGAITSSVAHDAHNLIAVGCSDAEILRAIDAVIHMNGGMVAIAGEQEVRLPLDCGGLMSTLPYPEVASRLEKLHAVTRKMGGIDDPFMYLSFLSLTVIPSLRITDRGVFDVNEFRDVPLFFSGK
ncbi:MAG: adenine deaminase [Methanomicrobiales archaeon HGW-Methanomicrobiales-1]|jgi:adenine deaminase|nr:MAG: adenine deaminase [Methanomicrobiales archaeon HGW-Methanomicrobiales-1]